MQRVCDVYVPKFMEIALRVSATPQASPCYLPVSNVLPKGRFFCVGIFAEQQQRGDVNGQEIKQHNSVLMNETLANSSRFSLHFSLLGIS